MTKRNGVGAIIIWSITVLSLSALCYLPMLFEQLGFSVSNIFLNMKYLFILIPFVVSLCYAVKNHCVKKWLSGLFCRKQFEIGMLISLLFLVIGIGTTVAYSLMAKKSGIFAENYPNFPLVAAQFIYLFVMAFIEEIAWRGFFLNKLSKNGERIRYTFITGTIWGIWHIPMWSIRNMLGMGEVFLLFVWSLLLAVVLGNLFYKYHNILLCALLHTIFNICFSAPILWNIVIITIIVFIAVGIAWKRNLIKW